MTENTLCIPCRAFWSMAYLAKHWARVLAEERGREEPIPVEELRTSGEYLSCPNCGGAVVRV